MDEKSRIMLIRNSSQIYSNSKSVYYFAVVGDSSGVKGKQLVVKCFVSRLNSNKCVLMKMFFLNKNVSYLLYMTLLFSWEYTGQLPMGFML